MHACCGGGQCDRKEGEEIRSLLHLLSASYHSLVAVAVCAIVIIRSMRVAVEKVVVVKLTKGHGLTDSVMTSQIPNRLSMPGSLQYYELHDTHLPTGQVLYHLGQRPFIANSAKSSRPLGQQKQLPTIHISEGKKNVMEHTYPYYVIRIVTHSCLVIQ